MGADVQELCGSGRSATTCRASVTKTSFALHNDATLVKDGRMHLTTDDHIYTRRRWPGTVQAKIAFSYSNRGWSRRGPE